MRSAISVTKLGLPVHLDGARIFNAAVFLGIPVSQLTAKADTVMFCLSKGLGAPVGSMLVGSAELIDRARIYRKALGGGMRQAGILAAAGLIALEQGPRNYRPITTMRSSLREGLAQIPGFKIDPAKVQTNIVLCDITGTGRTSGELACALAGAQGAGERRWAGFSALRHPPRRQPRTVQEALAVVAEVFAAKLHSHS